MNLPAPSPLRRVMWWLAVWSQVTFAQGQAVQPAHQYDFTQSFADAAGGSPMESGGGTLYPALYKFRAGEGPHVSKVLASPGEYTIWMVVKLSDVTRYKGLINFDNLERDRMLYVRDGCINFFPISRYTQSRTVDLFENRWHSVALTRDGATCAVSCYVDGRLRLAASDPQGQYVANGNAEGILHFCRDDDYEHSAGELDQVRIFHRALTAAEIAALGAAPDMTPAPNPVVAARPARVPVGRPPVASELSVTLGGEKGNVITLSGRDDDAGSFLSYLIVTPPARGTLTGSGAVRIYTPAEGFTGTDSFTFIAHDGAFGSTPATVRLTINPGAVPAVSEPALPEFADPHPSPDNGFRSAVVKLHTGNVVVTSPQADIDGVTDCGAVYLFNGRSGALISTLTGSTANDYAGDGGVTALANGNFVVCSPKWDHGTIPDAGAITWGHGSTGISGAVGGTNSLIGSTAYDLVGLNGVTALANGNYVVCSAAWDCGAATDAGAVTWGEGSVGVLGAVSAENSLTGSTANNLVGCGGVTVLPDGNYIVSSPAWDHGTITNAGATTRGDGSAGLLGTVSPANSEVGPQR